MQIEQAQTLYKNHLRGVVSVEEFEDKTGMTVADYESCQTITAGTYFVFYSDHDSGSDSAGVMIREGQEIAERSASLLDQCGYRHIEVRHAASVGDLVTYKGK